MRRGPSCTTSAPASGEPMLLIQGMSATHLAWGRAVPRSLLEPSFDCIVFDNRGMGLSAPAERAVHDRRHGRRRARPARRAGDRERPRRRHLDGRDDRPGAGARPPRAAAHADPRLHLLRRPGVAADGPEPTSRAWSRRWPRATASGSSGRCGRSTSPPPSAPTRAASPTFTEMAEALPAPRADDRAADAGAAPRTTPATASPSSRLPTLVIHGTADRAARRRQRPADRRADPRRPARAARGRRPHVLVGAAAALGRADPRARAGAGLSGRRASALAELRSRPGSSLPLTLKT